MRTDLQKTAKYAENRQSSLPASAKFPKPLYQTNTIIHQQRATSSRAATKSKIKTDMNSARKQAIEKAKHDSLQIS